MNDSYELDTFENYLNILSEKEKSKIKKFFKHLNEICLIELEEKKKIENDFENAIIFYLNDRKSLDEALEMLNLKYLGNFYSNITTKKFELDDSAKILSLTTSYDFTSMFRLSVYLKEDIIPEILQIALNFTIKRYPTFTTKLKKGFFWHYLESNFKRYNVELEKDIPCQPIDFLNENSQLFRVLYYKNRISIEIFHGLTDGNGGLIFLKSLLAEYLRLIGKKISLDETITDINSQVLEEELEDAFKKIPLTSEKVSENYKKQVFQFDDKLSKNRPCRIIHFNLDTEKLKLAAKKYNATITEYFLSLMLFSSKMINKKNNYNYSVLVPVNIRKYFSTKSIRNFTIFFMMQLSFDKMSDFFSTNLKVSEQMKKINTQTSIIKSTSIMKKIINFLKYIPLDLKRPGTKIFYSLICKKNTSNVLSNLGVVKFPKSISENIVNMDFFLNTSLTNSHLCSMITVNNVTTFSITKLSNDLIFEEKMYELLCNEGIIPIVEGSEFYEN